MKQIAKEIHIVIEFKDEPDALIKMEAKFETQPTSCIKTVGKNYKKLPE